MTTKKREGEEGRGFGVLLFYAYTVKLPVVRTPGPRVLVFVNAVGLVPQTIDSWNVNDLPMSALVKECVSNTLLIDWRGPRVITDDVSVNGVEPSPSTALTTICA